jgi:hypothetical protein
MPAEKERPTAAAFEDLANAWEDLARANEAFVAVDATASREWARVGLAVLKRRARALVTAVEAVEEATAV